MWIQQFRDPTVVVPEHFPRIAHTLVRLLMQENGYDKFVFHFFLYIEQH